MRGLAAAFLLAGCGADPVGQGNASTNQIERLSTPAREPETDPLASVRLRPLEPPEVAALQWTGPRCMFTGGEEVYLVAKPDAAVARVGGELRHFAHSAPLGETGGFFEDRQISLSVGRMGEVDRRLADLNSWPARIRVTDRRTGAQVDQDGMWRCGGRG